jgi:hypothetical protein
MTSRPGRFAFRDCSPDSGRPDLAAEFPFALLPEPAVLLAAESRKFLEELRAGEAAKAEGWTVHPTF